MHVTVSHHVEVEEGARFLHGIADQFGSVPDHHAAEQWQGRCIMAVRHDRIQDFVVFHAMTLARQKVVDTVSWSRVGRYRYRYPRNVFFRVNRGETPETLVLSYSGCLKRMPSKAAPLAVARIFQLFSP